MSTTKYASRSFIILAFCLLLVAGALSLAPAGQYEKACPTGWYFAEGYTGGSFDTWILIQNPFAVDTKASLRFFTTDGDPISMEVDIAGETRTSIYLNSVPGLEEGAEVATEVTVPGSGIICERAMYFDYQSGIGERSGGHATIGAPYLSGSWYLPEGYTGQGFDTFILLMNPGTEDANATVKLMKPGEGKYYPFKVVVPAGKRKTVKLDDLVWTEGTENIIAATAEPPAEPVQVRFDETDVATVIYSDKGIVAERAMYFDYYGKEGGSNSIGATGASPTWYLPEGYTGGDFDTWVLAMNPSYDTVDITYTFYSNQPGFEPVSVVHAGIAPWSRDSINVDAVPGLEGTDVSTKVTATRPVTLQTASAETPVERYAVLYGVEENLTADPNESYAVDDMYDLKHRLVDYCGFSYDKMRYRADDKDSTGDKVTLAQMQDDMDWLASVADANDIVVFYFAGSSSASVTENQIDLSDGSVGKAQLEAYFAALQTDNLVGMFDCDNSGELTGELAAPGRLLMGSCGKGELRHEYADAAYATGTSAAGNSPFDYYFVKGLSMKAADVSGNGLVSAEEAFNYAKPLTTALVTAQSAESQVPEIYDGIAGEVNLTVDKVPAGIVAERSVFFNYQTANDGATSIGAPELHTSWFLAEGYTGPGFDTFVLVMNPLDNWQKITATFMTPGGTPIEKQYDCPPNFRMTINVGEQDAALAGVDVSTRITAAYMDPPTGATAANYGGGECGVAVERAMYFVYTDPGDGSVKTGGTCSIGFGE
jgi:hypothetical protein